MKHRFINLAGHYVTVKMKPTAGFNERILSQPAFSRWDDMNDRLMTNAWYGSRIFRFLAWLAVPFHFLRKHPKTASTLLAAAPFVPHHITFA